MNPNNAQKMKFSIKDFFSKCDQIRRKVMKKTMKTFVFLLLENQNCMRALFTLRVQYEFTKIR